MPVHGADRPHSPGIRLSVAFAQSRFGSQRLIPGLDGLRAVSIGLVLLAHLMGTRHFPIASFDTPIGTLGVRVFFVISGFLITSILLSEIRRTGTVSLRRFYFRRSMRLFPAAFLLCATVAALSFESIVSLRPGDLSAALTYTMNFHRDRGWSLGHLWSLAVEEQFYLLWPWILVTLGTRRARAVLIGILFVAPLTRLTSSLVSPAFNFFIWSDALAAGCLLALCRSELDNHPVYQRVLSSRLFFLIPFVALIGNYVPSTKLQWLIGDTVVNLAIVATVDWSMTRVDGVVGRFLNSPIVSMIGVLSYSLYLWQQLFLNRYSASVYCAFPLNLVLAFSVALLSYLLVEAPCLRLRQIIEKTDARMKGYAAPTRP